MSTLMSSSRLRRSVALAAVLLLSPLLAPPAEARALQWRKEPFGTGKECSRGFSTRDSVRFKGRLGQGVDFGIKNTNFFGLTALVTQSKPSKNKARTVIFPNQTRWVYMSILANEPITYEWKFSTDSDSRAYVWYVRSNNCAEPPR